MQMHKEAALVEAVLFMESEPIDTLKIAKISQLSPEVVEKALEQLQDKYLADNSAFELSEIGGGWSLALKAEIIESLRDHYGKKADERLSRSALETLSIVAYSQPLTRAEIESIRGVSCSATLKLLQEKNLIKEVGRKEGPGRPVQFGTTKEFLQLFGLNTIADLPKLDDTEREKFELKEGS